MKTDVLYYVEGIVSPKHPQYKIRDECLDVNVEYERIGGKWPERKYKFYGKSEATLRRTITRLDIKIIEG